MPPLIPAEIIHTAAELAISAVTLLGAVVGWFLVAGRG